MEAIIVRHGLSEANKAGIIGTDSNLAPEGEKQAMELADRLQPLDIDAIYSSPLKRASQTALPLAESLGKEMYIDRRIREVDWGDFDGKPDSFFASKIGTGPREALDSYEFDFHAYHGESAADVEARVKSFVEDLKTEPYARVLVVCHGGIVRMLHYVITGKRIPWQPNGQEIHLKI
jgi:broad specificity phosphatase PhoE